MLTQDDEGFPFEYALLLAALLSVDSLGGNKSVGLGRCHLAVKDSSLRWNGRAIGIDDALASFAQYYDESKNQDDWTEMLQLIREENMT